MPGIEKGIEQAKLFWSGLSGKQRLMMVGGLVITLAVIGVFVRMIGEPDYKPLFTGLEGDDAHTLASQLTAKNIPNKISADGKSISVPADQVDTARMEVASTGMPHSGRLGFELFDKMSWGQTEFDEKVNYQRALEGELERTIGTLRNVESARVHLVMPQRSVFIDRDRSAKASVILKLRRGTISDDTQMAITRLVSGAVEDLNPEDVAVIDAETNRPLGRQGRGGQTGGSDELAQRLVATLEPVVGADRIKASVNVEYDPSTSEQSEEKYDPTATVALTMQRSEEQIGGSGLSGVPGTSSNVPGAKSTVTTTKAGDGVQVSRTESGTYAVNRTVRRTVEPAGRVRRITAALLVDDALQTKQENGQTLESTRKRSPEELKQIEDLAKAAIGIDTTRGDTVTVQNLTFARMPAEHLPPPTRVEKVRTTLNNWSSAMRYGALVLLFLLAYVLILRPIKKQAVKALKEHPAKMMPVIATPEAEPLELDDLTAIAKLGDVTTRAASLKKHLLEKVTKQPSESSRAVQAWLREGD